MENTTKTCRRCDLERPLTTEHFARRTVERDGFDRYCKPCAAQRRRERHQPPHVDANAMKVCNTCKRSYPQTLDHFAANRHAKDGLTYTCKACRNPNTWWEAWQGVGENEKRCPMCGKALPLTSEYWHKDRYRVSGYQSRCKACASSLRKAYYKEHRDDAIEQAHMGWHRRRAARNAADADRITTADIAKKVEAQNGRCFYCGRRLKGKHHIDHYFPISKGGPHALGNIVIACAPCNLAKKDRDPYVFMANR